MSLERRRRKKPSVIAEKSLQPLEPSRKRPKPGDVFVMSFVFGYMAGRVASVDAQISQSMATFNIVYVYDAIYQSIEEIDPRDLLLDRLLIPPVITNNQGWLKGYFQTIASEDLKDGDVLSIHCFKSPSSGTFWDGYCNELSEPVPPVGHHVLNSYLTIADAISRALGKGPTIDY